MIKVVKPTTTIKQNKTKKICHREEWTCEKGWKGADGYGRTVGKKGKREEPETAVYTYEIIKEQIQWQTIEFYILKNKLY